ncbi:serine hydrolase-like protein 2 isoform X1 [Balaenoptera musculus]|uniref:Serine hydrolase like 2 n=1 Tax=Balaenoptera musculus TaxID=9771 RepID=A0A8B8YQL4_BALMU|nr:serine hydrolase-like protein 2 isoform X1 [Balaenoptera musculus]
MGEATCALPSAHPLAWDRGGGGARRAPDGLISELKLAVPWGHIAAKAWGSHQSPPVLCLHGWLDNANSFDRIIPLLPKDFYYVAMDFGGHGLSSHYSPGFPYDHQNFVSEVRRVAAALKWNRFSLLGHSFGGTVGGMFSCIFPEMVDKLVLLESSPFILESNELENMLTYKRRAIEHVLQVEASEKPSHVVSPEEMLQGFLKNNSHVGDECAKLLLQRGTTQVATGLLLNRDRRITRPEYYFNFISRELFVHSIRKLQARVLLIKATQGYYDVRRENDANMELMLFVTNSLRSILKERFQYVQVPGNHYVHMNQPQHMAGVISSFLLSKERIRAQL